MGVSVEPELLKAFLAVAELGGFSAAAKQLNVTQSTVSLQIKRLEERVGSSLFHRTSRTVTLTEAGAILVPYAERILRLNGEAQDALACSSHVQEVRVGMTDEQAGAYLPYILPVFTRSFPDYRLQVFCDTSPVLVERVHDGLLDIAITIRHPDARGGTLIGQETLCWIGSGDFELALDEDIPLAVNPEGCVYRASAIAALNRIGRRWRIAFTSSHPISTNIAVQTGLGIAVKAVRSLPRGCRVLGGQEGLPSLGTVAVEMHTSGPVLSEPVQMIRNLLLQTAERHEGFVAAV
ncbi:LysR family transcriptional regulator [Dichotomicrobium thermohalophilum]|uniref:LysR family transcriptional regulator n=1 Tax=Dichotomicrobium thermohalophilum TaxID=933063 RepID=A0A397Q7B6_9HYPH|nr:LysR family transcriptional regulator [Dichotomicrobium thermohalophilum]RIA56873.1 LysR family transcriptional regulator [Dichotomicrobium thermohalophilum]